MVSTVVSRKAGKSSSFSQPSLYKIVHRSKLFRSARQELYYMAINKGIRSKEMKNIIITTGLILLISAIGFGQKQKQVSTSGSGSGSSNSSVTSDKGIKLDSGTTLNGELQNTLDVKKASVGDPVILKTTKAIKENGQTIVPKGTQLVGRVTEVAQKTKSNGGSRLGMVFDRIEQTRSGGMGRGGGGPSRLRGRPRRGRHDYGRQYYRRIDEYGGQRFEHDHSDGWRRYKYGRPDVGKYHRFGVPHG